jgi:hypothetical protein
MISVTDSAQPRPRAQVASSTCSAARNTSRVSAVRSIHAAIKSQAGSPTTRHPKSMTALSRPCWASRFPALRSPSSQTAGPRRHLERRFPRRGHRVGIERVVEGGDRVASAIVSHCQWHAAGGIVRRGWSTGGIDPLQGGDEVRQIGRRLAKIGDTVDARVLALEPSVHRPRPRVALGWDSFRERDGDGERQVRGESRQPPVFLLHLPGGRADAGGAVRPCRRQDERWRCPSPRIRPARSEGLPT